MYQTFVGYKSDRGLSPQRPTNEDSYNVYEPAPDNPHGERGRLYVVADGMGGAAGGEVASRLAVQTVTDYYYGGDWQGPAETLRQAVRAANQAIYAAAQQKPELQGMGSTVTALAVLGDKGYIAHVGDTRCYGLHEGQLVQLTLDHSLVAEQVRQGVLTPEQARASSHRNIITRVLGNQPDVEVDIHEVAAPDNATFVLTTDGVHGELSDSEIERAVTLLPAQDAADHIVAQVLERGAPDNATVVVIQGEKVTRRGRLPKDLRPHRPLIAVLIPTVAVILVGGLLGAALIFKTDTAERRRAKLRAEAADLIGDAELLQDSAALIKADQKPKAEDKYQAGLDALAEANELLGNRDYAAAGDKAKEASAAFTEAITLVETPGPAPASAATEQDAKQRIAEAKKAIGVAQQERAGRYAPNTLKTAQGLLAEAEKNIRQRNWDASQRSAAKAVKSANSAAEQARKAVISEQEDKASKKQPKPQGSERPQQQPTQQPRQQPDQQPQQLQQQPQQQPARHEPQQPAQQQPQQPAEQQLQQKQQQPQPTKTK